MANEKFSRACQAHALQRERPQGWKLAQMAKRGRHSCHYNCGNFFRSTKEAAHHLDCPVKREMDERLQTLCCKMGISG